MRKTQKTIVNSACETTTELAVVQGVGRVVAMDATTGLEVLLAAARKSRVGIDAALQSGIPIA